MVMSDNENTQIEADDHRALAVRFFGLLSVLGEVEPSVLLKDVEGNTALAKAVRKLLQIPEPVRRGRGRPADSVFNEALVLCVDATVAAGGTIDAAIKRIVLDEGHEDDENRFETLRTRYWRARKSRKSKAPQLSGLVGLFGSIDPSGGT